MAINAGLQRFSQPLKHGRSRRFRETVSDEPMLHIDIPTLEEFKALAQIKGETCVSLYMPTSPLGTSAKFNRTAFKDLAKEALSQMKEAGVDKNKISVFEEQFA